LAVHREKKQFWANSHQALNKQNTAAFVANSLAYGHVKVTSRRGSVTRRMKELLNFEILIMPNSCQVMKRTPNACYAMVCFWKDNGEKWIYYSSCFKWGHTLYANSEGKF
jgi:hypothetical protein